MGASYSLAELPPGLYHLDPAQSPPPEMLANRLREQGAPVLTLPLNVTDFLVADSVRRELAFDLENEGLTGPALHAAVDRLVRAGSGQVQDAVREAMGNADFKMKNEKWELREEQTVENAKACPEPGRRGVVSGLNRSAKKANHRERQERRAEGDAKGADSFAEQVCRQTGTLSGGEQQLLALSVAARQSYRYILGQACLDFLSAANLEKVAALLETEEKCLLEWSYRQGSPSWRIEDGTLHRIREEGAARTGHGVKAGVVWELELEGLRKQFPQGGFTLDIPQFAAGGLGILGICGDNGSGKSTLADCLAGITDYQGAVRARGPDGLELPAVGYLVQQAHAPTYGLSADEIIGQFQAQGRLTEADSGTLKEVLHNEPYASTLGAADRRTGHRLLVAVALLVGRYDLIILDEPTYGLPVEDTTAFLGAAIEEAGGKPLICISHDRKFLASLCTANLQLDHGKIHGTTI